MINLLLVLYLNLALTNSKHNGDVFVSQLTDIPPPRISVDPAIWGRTGFDGMNDIDGRTWCLVSLPHLNTSDTLAINAEDNYALAA